MEFVFYFLVLIWYIHTLLSSSKEFLISSSCCSKLFLFLPRVAARPSASSSWALNDEFSWVRLALAEVRSATLACNSTHWTKDWDFQWTRNCSYTVETKFILTRSSEVEEQGVSLYVCNAYRTLWLWQFRFDCSAIFLKSSLRIRKNTFICKRRDKTRKLWSRFSLQRISHSIPSPFAASPHFH